MKKIFGHRGLPLTYMENSITSLNAALEYCDYVETDVRITADSNLILFHDPDLNERFIKLSIKWRRSRFLYMVSYVRLDLNIIRKLIFFQIAHLIISLE